MTPENPNTPLPFTPELPPLPPAFAPSTPAPPPPLETPPPPTPGKRFWRKFGGDSFLISLGVHVALVLLLVTWVVSRVVIETSKPETIEIPGGSSNGQTVSMTPRRPQAQNNRREFVKSPEKIKVSGPRADVAITDIPSFNMSALETGALGGASKGLGGKGLLGGKGDGFGPGSGSGRHGVSLFGVSGFNMPGLVGVFYDFKQDPKGTFKDPERDAYIALVRGYMKSDWSENYLRARFFAAPDKLALTHVFIPQIPAEEAPKAYNVADKVKPSRWMAHYKGKVKAPISGRFRFVGMADDWIVVRWGKRIALDSGYDIVAQPDKHQGPPLGVGDTFPSQLPRPLRCGPWLSVSKGTEYPLELALGETPGGVFYAYLCYETENERGKLKLFRMSADPLTDAIKRGDPRIPDLDMTGGGLVWLPERRGNATRK
jgi:hypothetical protein